MSRSLAVLLGGRRAGLLTQGEGGVLSLDYDPDYRDSVASPPVSLSMPLTDASHRGPVVRAFCQGLLPDNESVLERWGRDFQGQFSLAGAQAKTALHFDANTERWSDPSGAVPTTHILKPAIAGFDDHDLNEHLCLRAASRTTTCISRGSGWP